MSTPEGQVLRSILDYLAVKRVMAFRMNTGAVKIDKRFMRFGTPGMADILAFYKIDECTMCGSIILPLWIECKAGKGKQSEAQKSFQEMVEAEGHTYLLARSIGDVERFLQEHGA